MLKQFFFATIVTIASLPSIAQTFEITSSDVGSDKTIPNKFVFNGFGCNGNNLSPEVAWKNVPAGTKSFALMVHDPDAPTGGAGFWHWVVVNLPASVSSLAQGAGTADGGALPQGARQIQTDFGTSGWGGPCPPAGAAPHRYRFTVYALTVDKLDLPDNATASLSGFMINMNMIGKASFTALYGR
ncbi:MAG: YbhB/YbcL family Raf kinase inhibitor-like protein [Glaciimonas sp.]|nr:YbhB/YbcL family Raf kinase inhibitor-like protein [Glaciimonas sp.]